MTSVGQSAAPIVPRLGAQKSIVLFDDTFGEGFCGWEELYTDPAGATNVATSGPLTLGSHTQAFGSRTHRLATHSVADPAYASQCNALKRLSVPPGAGRGIVLFENWFAFGSESVVASAPRYLYFMIDEMYGGQRTFWKTRWRQWDEGGGTKAMDWWVSSVGENTMVAAGPAGAQFQTDFPFNGNKGDVLYTAFEVDLGRRVYGKLYGLDQTFDLSQTPGLSPPVAATDQYFNNGLNFLVSVVNRASTATTASWMELARSRATVVG